MGASMKRSLKNMSRLAIPVKCNPWLFFPWCVHLSFVLQLWSLYPWTQHPFLIVEVRIEIFFQKLKQGLKKSGMFWYIRIVFFGLFHAGIICMCCMSPPSPNPGGGGGGLKPIPSITKERIILYYFIFKSSIPVPWPGSFLWTYCMDQLSIKTPNP